jgi:oxygen-independent coproporphyrinogen-3 oxidase
MLHDLPRAAYIHVPFCAHHCGYCDFAVAAGQDHLMDRYLDALEVELSSLGEARPVQTVFIGGGTPTYLAAPQLDRLLTAIDRWLPRTAAADDLPPNRAGAELSVEATPDSLTEEKVALLRKHGVHRVSIGAQSFHPHLLRTLERTHDPEAVPRSVAWVQDAAMQVSLDLIFGAPGQSFDDWDTDLRQALALRPDHIATYGLTYEKGTRLWKQRERGSIQALDEDAELALYTHAIDTLEAAGFEHYEVSNFARPGCRSRHNQFYWANEPYYGFGVGAARYVTGSRELNVRNTALYIQRVLAGKSPTFQAERLGPEERARETLVVQLRRADGVNAAAFRQQTGHDLETLAGAALGRLVDLGYLLRQGETYSLTRSGKYVADALVRELL